MLLTTLSEVGSSDASAAALAAMTATLKCSDVTRVALPLCVRRAGPSNNPGFDGAANARRKRFSIAMQPREYVSEVSR